MTNRSSAWHDARKQRPRRDSRVALVALAVVSAWLTAFLGLPLVQLFVGNVALGDVRRVIGEGAVWRVVWFSAWQASLSVLATFVIAMPVTLLIGSRQFRGRRLLRATTTVGFLLPSVVVAAAFLAVLPRSMRSTMTAVVLAHAYFNIAVVVRVVGSRLEAIDARLLQASRALGAVPLRVMTTFIWPLVRGAVASAGAVVFLYCFTSYAVVRLLGGPSRNTVESDIALRAFGIGDVSSAGVLAVLQVIIITAVVGVVLRSAGRHGVELRAAAGLTRLSRRGRPAAAVVAVATGGFVVVPLLAVLWQSVRVSDAFTLLAWRSTGETWILESVASSLRTAAVAGLLGLLLAGAAALAVVRLPRLGRMLDPVSVVPLAVSPVTVGLGLVVTFDQSWYDWRGAWWFVAVAHTLVAFPLVVRVLVPAWRAIPERLHEAAAVLGAGGVRRIVDVDLRLLRRSFVAGSGLAVAVSLGEFGAASLLSRRGVETMPVAITRLLGRTGDLVRAQAFVLASMLIGLCFVAMLVVELALGRGAHASRR